VNKAKEEKAVFAGAIASSVTSGPVVDTDADVAAATGSQRPGPTYSNAQVAAEVLWLDRYTSEGSSWRSIRDRVSQTRTAAQKRVRKNRSGLVDRFLSNLPSPEHSAAHQRDAVVAEVGRSLLQQWVDESVLALCDELVDGVRRALGLIISAIVPVVAGISDRNARFSRISGREHLTEALLSDCRYEHGPPSQDGDDDVRITMPMLKKASPPQPAPAPVPTVSLDGDAWMPGQALRQAEADYWMRETAVSPIAGGPLQCPPGCGFPTAVRLFTPCSATPSSSSSGRAAAGRMGRRGASSVLVCGR
jgi:type II secretory pathway pseudopilin PulG